MSRITGTDARSLMEAYNAVYAPQVNEDYLWESYLTEEFISEAYQTVADYLVHNGFVPGYNTAEVYMSEMAVEDIDSILFETGVLNEQYLIEAGFFQGIGAGADRFVSGAQKKVQGAVAGAKRAGNAVVGGAQRLGKAATGYAQGAARGAGALGQTAVGGVQKAVTPVAKAVQGTAQRAVSAGQSALGGAARTVQGAKQAVVGGAQRLGTAAVGAVKNDIGNKIKMGQAIAGGVQRSVNAVGSVANSATRAVGSAVNAAGRKIEQEVEISRKVGAGEPLKVGPKIVGPKIVGTGPRNFGSKAMAEKNKQGALTASFDMFDTVLEYLVAEGYADTNESALVIMANMSEDWREGIVEAQEARNNPEKYEKEPGKKKSKKQAMDDPHTGINSPAFNAFMRKQMGR